MPPSPVGAIPEEAAVDAQVPVGSGANLLKAAFLLLALLLLGALGYSFWIILRYRDAIGV
jgi:hypothetical protein